MKHVISIAEMTPEEVWQVVYLAEELKEKKREGTAERPLQGKTLALLFQKPSLRTRFSFDAGIWQLGGHPVYLSPDEVQLGQREITADVARVLGRYADGIMARVFDHAHIKELAAHAGVPVINGLSDFNHPCQALSDLFTIYENHNSLEGLKLAYLGDGNNVCHSLLFAASKVGMDIAVATPEGYEPDVEVGRMAAGFAQESGGDVLLTHDPREAAADADVLYTDVWISMGDEAEGQRRLQVFPPYQLNQELVTQAKPDTLVMHCLPAHRGEEITDEVIEGPQSVVFDQAENRLHAQKAILVLLLGPEGT